MPIMDIQENTRVGVRTKVVVVAAVFLVLFGLVMTVVLKPASKKQPSALQTTQLATITRRLEQLSEHYQQAATKERAATLTVLKQVANQRKAMITRALAKDPKTAIANLLPSAALQRLPEEIRGDLEAEATLEGTVEILHSDDFKNGTSKDEYRLHADNNDDVSLYFAVLPTMLEAKEKVRVRGFKIGTSLLVSGTLEENVSVLTAPAPLVSGTKKAAVIAFKFLNSPAFTWTPDLLRQYVFTDTTSVAAYFKETSFNQVTLAGRDRPDGDVYGIYAFNYNDTPCNTPKWAADAKAAVTDAGGNLSGYDYFIYYFPNAAACQWTGYAIIGGNESWHNGYSNSGIIAHEVGHNFGAAHANGLVCVDANGQAVPISNTCTSYESIDAFDVMGQASASRQMNTYHKAQLGWYSGSNLFDLTASGSQVLEPTETTGSGIKALRIPRLYNATGQVTEYYYLEYRRSFGVFDRFLPNDPVVNGVSIRLGPPLTNSLKSQLLDVSPTTPPTLEDSSLKAGQNFVDVERGVTISIPTAGITPASATVDVQLSCAHNNPSIPTVSPSVPYPHPGETVQYAVTVRNNDNPFCPPATFSVNSTLPGPDWSQTGATVTLAPFESRTVTTAVTSPSNAADSRYTIGLRATNVNTPAFTALRNEYYTIDATPPSLTMLTPLTLEIFTAGQAVTITSTASDALSRVKSMDVLADGVLVNQCPMQPVSCSGSWPTASVSYGQHAVTVTATDNAGNTGQVARTIVVRDPSDLVAPAVSIISPQTGAQLTRQVAIEAAATDNVRVTRIEFFRDGGFFLGGGAPALTTGKLSISWDTITVRNGSHTLFAKAYDAAGNVSASPSVTVTVCNPATSTCTAPPPAPVYVE